MDEAVAKLYLLDLGEGAQYRSDEVDEMVTKLQQDCGITKRNSLYIRAEIRKSDSVIIETASDRIP
jgi:hypothetical protein